MIILVKENQKKEVMLSQFRAACNIFNLLVQNNY